MNLIDVYQIIQNVKHLRELELTKYNLNVIKANELYIVHLDPAGEPIPVWNRLVAFATEFPKDISNLMDIYEFANSKGAVEFECR